MDCDEVDFKNKMPISKKTDSALLEEHRNKLRELLEKSQLVPSLRKKTKGLKALAALSLAGAIALIAAAIYIFISAESLVARAFTASGVTSEITSHDPRLVIDSRAIFLRSAEINSNILTGEGRHPTGFDIVLFISPQALSNITRGTTGVSNLVIRPAIR